MAKIALLTLHGMGLTQPGYANEMKERLQERLDGSGKHFALFPAYYQDLLQFNERLVWERTTERGKIHYDDLRKFVLFGFGDAAGLENRKEFPNSVYEKAQLRIAGQLQEIRNNLDPSAEIVLLTHSLGCHVLSSYIYDAQKFRKGSDASAGIWKADHPFVQGKSDAELEFLACGNVKAWITTGCNIPIFVAAHGAANIVAIDPPRPGFRWINLYDPDDVLGWPLQPLCAGYDDLVEDRAINAGQGILNFLTKSWNPMSHTAYWTDHDVIKPLAELI